MMKFAQSLKTHWLVRLLSSSILIWLIACTTITPTPDNTLPTIATIQTHITSTEIPPSPIPPASPTYASPTAAIPISQSEPIEPATPTRKPKPSAIPTPTLAVAVVPTPGTQGNAGQPASFLRDETLLPQSLQTLTLQNITGLREIARWGRGSIRDFRYSPDGNQAVAITSQGIYFYSTATYELISFTPIELNRDEFALSPNLQYVAAGKYEGGIELFDVHTGQLIYRLSTPAELESLYFSYDSRYLYFEALQTGKSVMWNYQTIYVWDIPENSVNQVSPLIGTHLEFSPYHGMILEFAIGVQVWRMDNPQTPELVVTIPNIDDSWNSYNAAISPDQSLVAVGFSGNMKVAVYRISDGQLLYEVPILPPTIGKAGSSLASPARTSGPGDVISSLVFSPDGQRIAALTCFYGTIHQIDVKTGQLVAYARVPSQNCGQLAYSPDGSTLAAWEVTASFLDVQRNSLVFTLPNHSGKIRDLKFSPDGQSIAAGSYDAKLWLRRVMDGTITRVYAGHQYEIESVAFSPDGKYLATGSRDKTIRLWDTQSHNGWFFYKARAWIVNLVFSSDSKWLAAETFDDYVVSLLNVRNGTLRFEISDLIFAQIETVSIEKRPRAG